MTMPDRAAVVSQPHLNGTAQAATRYEPAIATARVGPSVGWRSDLSFLFSLALVLLIGTSLPYLWAYASTPPDQQFMGLTYTTHDYGQYMSWARESRDRFFVENKLTAEQTAPTFFNPVWWLVGRAERLLGLSFAQVNQILRVVAGIAFVLTLGAFVGLVIPGPERRFAVILACLTSGLGWVLVLAKQVTGELSDPLLVHTFPGNTFFGMMVVPHMILSASMLVGTLGLMLESYRRRCGRRALLAGLLCLGLGFAHPYNIVTVYSVIGAFALLMTLRDGWRPRWIAAVAAFYGLSAPSVLYWLWVSAGSAEWRQVLAQYANLGVFTPDPARLTVLLGLTAILAVLTLRGLVPLRERPIAELFVGVWLIVNLFIVYLPFNFQINLLNGIQVPLAILATWGLHRHVMPWLREVVPARGRQVVQLVPLIFILAVLPTNVYLLSWRLLDVGRHNYPDFLYRDDVAALRWLEQSSQPSDVVLSSLVIGHYVPGLTGAHALLAHGANTLNFQDKRSIVSRFFSGDSDLLDRQAPLKRYGVRFVFHGPAERALGTFDPSTAPYLRLVFSTPQTSVYEFQSTTATVER